MNRDSQYRYHNVVIESIIRIYSEIKALSGDVKEWGGAVKVAPHWFLIRPRDKAGIAGA